MDKAPDMLYGLLGTMVHVEIDRPVGYRHGDMIYPINYGFLPGLIAGDAEEQDAYILGVSEPLSCFDGCVIGIIRRKNDCEDKLVVAPAGMSFHQGQIAEAVRFQEQYFDTAIDCLLRKSCGVLPYRMAGKKREYLIVYEHYSQCWSLPKGHMEAGETEEQTALRELYEETGLTARLDTKKSAMIEYPVSDFARKQVLFFPGYVSGSLRLRDGEIERYKWVSGEELGTYLFPDTAEACRRLIRTLEIG